MFYIWPSLDLEFGWKDPNPFEEGVVILDQNQVVPFGVIDHDNLMYDF